MGFLNETGLARFWQHIVTKLGEKLNISDAVGRKGEGDYSEIFNDYTGNVASGSYSHAEGSSTTSSAYASHTEGYLTIANTSDAHAEGLATRAYASAAHSEGYMTFAKGDYSHAEGGTTVAYGNMSHAEGSGNRGKIYLLTGEANATTLTYTMQSTYDSACVGDILIDDQTLGSKIAKIVSVNSTNSTITLDNPLSDEAISNKRFAAEGGAIGAASHSEGNGTIALGHGSHAEGSQSIAYGMDSHAENVNTKAIGAGSHAEGINSTAYGDHSHAEGEATVRAGFALTGEANATTYTIDNTNLDVNNIIYCEGQYARVISVDETNSTITVDKTLNADYAINNVPIKVLVSSAIGQGSHIEGKNNVAIGDFQHVEGKYNLEDANNELVHIVGNGDGTHNRSNAHTLDWEGNAWYSGDVYVGSTLGKNKDAGSKKLATEEYVDNSLSTLPNSNIVNGSANGSLRTINSVAESGTYSLGTYAFAEGNNTKASGQSSHAEGNITEASGPYAHAEGSGTKATGSSSHAEGESTQAGYCAHSEGRNTKALGSYSHAEGYSSQATGIYSHAQGNNSKAEGQSSSAAGTYSTAKGYYSNAMGYYLLSNEAYETVIGKYNLGTNVATNTITTTNTTYNFNTSGSYTCSTTAPTVNLTNGTITWTNTTTKRPYQFSTNNYVKLNDTSYGRITGSGTTSGSYMSFPIERKTLQLAITQQSPYAFIIGNGTMESARSNAHTLDWDGNAWYSGEVYVKGTQQSEGTMLAHQPKILEVSVPSTSLETGTNYLLGVKILYPNDVIEIKPDYTKDTSVEYREAIRNANFGSKFEVIYEYDDGSADYNFYVVPDGEIDTSIENYYFYVINHGPGGAW